MKKIRWYITLLALLFSAQAFSQAQCLLFDMSQREPVFQSGEKITYTLSYIVAGMWVNVGEATFLTTRKVENRRPIYHIEVHGKTYPFFDRIFRIRDYFTTKIDAQTLKPFYMRRNIDEGGYRLTGFGHYDWDNSVIYTTTQRLDREQPARRDTLKLTPCTFDVVSIFYYYRSCDFSQMKERTPYSVQIVMDGKMYDIHYTLIGKEVLNVRGVGRFNTLRFSATPIAGTVFTGKERISFWITDDENRVPVYIDAPIRFGSVRARISNWENLKQPMTSKL